MQVALILAVSEDVIVIAQFADQSWCGPCLCKSIGIVSNNCSDESTVAHLLYDVCFRCTTTEQNRYIALA